MELVVGHARRANGATSVRPSRGAGIATAVGASTSAKPAVIALAVSSRLLVAQAVLDRRTSRSGACSTSVCRRLARPTTRLDVTTCRDGAGPIYLSTTRVTRLFASLVLVTLNYAISNSVTSADGRQGAFVAFSLVTASRRLVAVRPFFLVIATTGNVGPGTWAATTGTVARATTTKIAAFATIATRNADIAFVTGHFRSRLIKRKINATSEAAFVPTATRVENASPTTEAGPRPRNVKVVNAIRAF